MVKKIVKHFRHLIGSHCESSSMRDIIEYLGISMSESMIFGLDATMGFIFIDNSEKFNPDATFNMNLPFFVGGKQGTITDNSLGCRILGLSIKKETFKSPDEAWISSKKLIDQNIPLILLVDMGLLSYFKWEEEFHFGMHSVVLCGYDELKEVAYLCDNNFKEIIEVPLEELKKARNSKYGSKYMHPNNIQFIIKKRADGKKPPFPVAVKLALRQVSNNIRAASINSQGLTGMKLFAKSIPNWNNILKGNITYLGKSVSKAFITLENLYGFIEEYGTGGGLFRNLYAQFLKDLPEHSEIVNGQNAWNNREIIFLNEAFEMIRESGDLWSSFAQEIKYAIEKDKENCLNSINFKKLEEIINEIIPLEEDAFKNLKQIKI
ncbi:MAG: BtrH N-terminal domain-containing protein [Promethearchaeota archaeon]